MVGDVVSLRPVYKANELPELAMALFDLDDANSSDGGGVLVRIIVPMGKDRGLTRETVKEILSEPGGYNETKCDPPWELSDDNANGLFKKVDNGFSYCRENAPGSATAQADFANDPVPTADEIATIAAWWADRPQRDRANDQHVERRKRAQLWEEYFQ